jgi:hypothetical protein
MRPRLIGATYSAAVFLSAALLFTIQLSFTKALLPLLGGTPAVWNTAVVFFQSTLLAGYAYAHAIGSRLTPRWQVRAHVALLAVSILTIPIAGLAGRTPPPTGSPVVWLIVTLVVTLGPTLFLLSATSPLIQAWFRHTGHERAADPYFLYAPSNLGSMLAVLGYPFLIEPFFTLRQQHVGWGVFYVAFGLVIIAAGLLIRRSPVADTAPGPVTDEPAAATPDQVPIVGAGAVESDADADEGERPAEVEITASPEVGDPAHPPRGIPQWSDRVWWVLLAMVPSSLVLGVTTYITTDVAAFPLMWVVPLSLYLFSFVLVFARKQRIPLSVTWTVQLLVIALWVATYFLRFATPAWWRFGLQLLLLFSTAMVCHSELVRRRPAAQYLTQFYLLLALGGALGAAFNALVAPFVFDDVIEYPLAIMIAALIRPVFLEIRLTRFGAGMEAGFTAVLVAAAVLVALWPTASWWIAAAPTRLLLVAATALVMVAGFRSSRRLALLVMALWVAGTRSREYEGNLLLRERSFFGVYEVRQNLRGGYHSFIHGTTLHGTQWRQPPERRTTPTSYYVTIGPVGDLFMSRDGFAESARIAIVGLGAGSLACYAKSPQQWTFFELDPLVEEIARDTTYFTYLRDCKPDARVVLGDARISLRDEPDGFYDLIMLDAFTSDAVPVHLLTREALQLYLEKLAPDGIIAYHISNRYVDLEPVLAALAQVEGLVALDHAWQPPGEDPAAFLIHPSHWLLMARDSAAFGLLPTQEGWHPPRTRADVRPWTDDFSSVPRVMLWRSRYAG